MGLPKEKYIGFQSKLAKHALFLQNMGAYSCLFLCLCSITEEYFELHEPERKFDILEAAIRCREKGLIDHEWTCKTVDILNFLTGRRWEKKNMEKLPERIPENMYTVEKWFNERTKYTHFRRRWGDTLDNSVTVKEGVLSCYYVFTHD